MTPFLIQLSENDKRIIICILIILIFIFVIVGLIALLIEKIMKKMGDKTGIMMSDVVKAKVVTNKKDFIRVGKKINNRVFAKQSLIAFLLLFLSLVFYLIYGAVSKNFSFAHLSEGFGKLFFQWDFAKAPRVIWFGISIISGWPPLVNTPHFEAQYWGSYIVYPLLIVGGVWLMITSLGHMSRYFRLRKISNLLFKQTIDPTLNPNITNEINNLNANNNVNNNPIVNNNPVNNNNNNNNNVL